MGLLLTKIVLSLLCGVLLIWTLLTASDGGVLREVQLLGWPIALLVVALFLLAVGFYCRDLQRLLERLPAHVRRTSPQSVWLMFLIPYNFIEDFFIIANIADALKKQASNEPWLVAFAPYGKITGLGWCAAQLMSISPTVLEQVASLIAFILWLMHWRFIAVVNAVLLEHSCHDVH